MENMQKMETILFPGKDSPYVVYDGTAVHSINGITPDENGDIAIEVGSGTPSKGDAYQQYVTDAEGNAKWEDRTHYSDIHKIVVKLDPEYDRKTSKGWSGGSASSDPEQAEAALAIGAEIQRNESRDWIFYWDGVRYSVPKQKLPFQYRPGGNIEFDLPFGFDAVSNGVTTMMVFHYEDGLKHVLEWEMLDSKIKQLDEDFIPDSIARKTDIPEMFSGSWNDLNDRPFYIERKQMTHENVTVGIAYDLGYTTLPYEFFPATGEVYTVTWNDKTYNYYAQPLTIDGEEVITIGSTVFFGGNSNTSTPFCVVSRSGRTIVYSKASGDYTISLAGYEYIPHKIPENYIDVTSVVGVIDSSYSNYYYLNPIKGASITEVREAAKEKNKDIVIRFDIDNWQGTMRYLGLMDISTDGKTYFPALIFCGIKANNTSINTSGEAINGTMQVEYWYTPLEPEEGLFADTFINLPFGEIDLANVAHKSDVERLTEEIAELKGTTETVTYTGTVVSVNTTAGEVIKVEADTTEAVTLVHQNKNFIGRPARDVTTIGDLTLTVNDDGTVRVVGTLTESGDYHYNHPNLNGSMYLPAGTYTLSNNFVPTRGAVLAVYYTDREDNVKVGVTPFNKDRVTFTLDEGANVKVELYINADAVTTGLACDFELRCQLEPGTEVTEYEPKVVYSSNQTSLPVTLTAENGKNVIYTKSGDELTASIEIKADGGIDEESVKEIVEETLKFNPYAWGLPVLELTGETAAMTKDDAVDLDYVYNDAANEISLNGTCSVKWQGSSSIRYAKKNYTIKFDNAFEAVEGWGAQKKYCFKANYIDHSHARNVVNAKLWGQIVKSRSDVPTELASLPNAGAVDGFPCIITLNGEFHGLYTFNIPKDGWMFGMGNGTNEAILCADQHVAACRFKGEANLSSDFEIEYVTDENNAEWVTTSINQLINACINSDGSDLDTTVAQYIDWQSVIDYYIFTVLITGDDMTDKNYLLATFDGVKWYFSAYDMDCTYGLFWDGSTFVQANNSPSFASYASMHRAMELVKTYKLDELKARYAQLRAGVLSESNIATTFANFTGAIASSVYMQDAKTWLMIPNTSTNNISQIRDYYRLRVEYADKWIEDLE